jgi:modulator of FtsH protease
MSLYDRHTYKESSNEFSTNSESQIVQYVKETYKLFAASMLSGAVGAYLSLPYASIIASNYWLIAIPWLLFGIFGLNFIKNKPGINMIGLYLFTFVSGVILAPLLTSVLSMAGGAGIVANAFLMTAVSFGSLSLFAMKSTKDFTGYGKPLMIAFIVMILFSLINIFVFQSPLTHIIIQGIFFFIISIMVIYDTQNIIQGNYETPMDGAIALYLDFFNMFTTLLQIFGFFSSED